jgi:hypothetical protein
LHDIGRLGLLSAYPAEYETMMAVSDAQPGDLILIEREQFGVDHVEAGVWLARKWNLPESIVEVIARHHETPTRELDQATVVQIACRSADLLGFSASFTRPGALPNLDEVFPMLPEWVRLRLHAQFRTLQDAIVREIRLLEASEAPPSASPKGGEEREPVDGTLDAPSTHYRSTPMADRLFSTSFTMGVVLAAVALLLSAAVLFFQR